VKLQTPAPQRPATDDQLLQQALGPERRWRTRSLGIGVVGTLLAHLLLIFAVPDELWAPLGAEPRERPRRPPLEIILQEEPEPIREPRYVTTNPDAPDNEPDETDAFSARNQQAANPEPAPQLSPDLSPARPGETETPFDQFISGSVQPPELEVVQAPPQEQPPAPEQQMQPESRPAEQIPMAGVEPSEGADTEGARFGSSDPSPLSQPTAERVEGERLDSTDQRPLAIATNPMQPQERRPAPQPRPRLPQALPSPVRQQIAGVNRVGAIGVDARFSQFGEYMERLREAVQMRWETVLSGRAVPMERSFVALRFTLTREGDVRDLHIVDTNAHVLGIWACQSAISDPAPYGLWTEEMVKVLGEEQVITFTFHYW
jgi:hypothetical protein